MEDGMSKHIVINKQHDIRSLGVNEEFFGLEVKQHLKVLFVIFKVLLNLRKAFIHNIAMQKGSG